MVFLIMTVWTDKFKIFKVIVAPVSVNVVNLKYLVFFVATTLTFLAPFL